jgi:NCAIR mutase (PurE)-related protein
MNPEFPQFARLDDHREERTGIPEIVWGENKTIGQLVSIVRRMTERQSLILVSRLDADKGLFLAREFPSGTYHPEARMFSFRQESRETVAARGPMLILAAGTSDIPVAEEAFVTASLLGNQVERIYDVGVAGIHRLFAQLDRIREASVLIVIAGMEGALPSVVAGLVGKPIVAVPTSIGYGTGLGGVAALLAMLNGCAPGVTVVNIDNGVGAAVAAHLINRV